MVDRYVSGRYTPRYVSTAGAAVWRVTAPAHGRLVEFSLWDLKGESDVYHVPDVYLQGAHAYMVVVDGTRRTTLETGLRLYRRLGALPGIFICTKADRERDWELQEQDLRQLGELGWPVFSVSAVSGQGLSEAFASVALLLEDRP